MPGTSSRHLSNSIYIKAEDMDYGDFSKYGGYRSCRRWSWLEDWLWRAEWLVRTNP